MTNPATVDRLVRLGLTQYEARAYVALVSRATSTPAEIARLARVPRPRIYDVLASLASKGLASERPGRAARFVGAPPERVAAVLMTGHRDRIAALEADASGVADDLRAAYDERERHTDPLDYIEVIRSPEAVATRFNDLQVGGTSLATPIVASMYAAAGIAGKPRYVADLYRDQSMLFDVAGGSNGTKCSGTYLCTAVPGYDGPTGLGSPDGSASYWR